jgi:hypothetical protein
VTGPAKPSRFSNFRIEEIDGKVYSVVTLDMRPRGNVQDMYQRLESKDTKLRKRWSGTTLGADHAYEKIQRMREDITRLKEK